jgi:hypothetical protein
MKVTSNLDPRTVTEAEFMAQVIELAGVFGWESAHFRPALTSRGWRTPVQGSMGKGFPDLILARRDRILFAELKRDGAKVTPEQDRVLDLLGAAAKVYVWRPADFDSIAEVLR